LRRLRRLRGMLVEDEISVEAFEGERDALMTTSDVDA
jgi:hypothetical protein